ncbi:hypothetical protein CFP56_009466 [Quercus suber]|uniref:Uncharacterized protein n=1 Tax=Quercus suber TaxID=58331 RepID=A0AAW0L426_QUESU
MRRKSLLMKVISTDLSSPLQALNRVAVVVLRQFEEPCHVILNFFSFTPQYLFPSKKAFSNLELQHHLISLPLAPIFAGSDGDRGSVMVVHFLK